MSLGERRGAYTADRAAALSGVPRSTVHYWARKGYLAPSVSAERVKLWSYADLMGLRTIYWLRQEKQVDNGRDVPRTTMPAVLRALEELRALDMSLWTEEGGPSVAVDRAGRVHLQLSPEIVEGPARARPLHADLLDLLRPFSTGKDTRGPDLRMPRPRLRIVPGKLSGSPHVVHTRIETIAIAALYGRGLSTERVHELYPVVDPAAIAEAIDLEEQLSRNLGRAA
jgi:uncharacterized protein (DUF433 family)